MIPQHLFTLISRLIFSRWARDYQEHHGSCEDVYAARIGPLHLEVNQCSVLDHDDAYLSLHIPTPWGEMQIGYVVCLGPDEIRQPGFYARWQKRSLRQAQRGSSPVTFGQAQRPADDESFPF